MKEFFKALFYDLIMSDGIVIGLVTAMILCDKHPKNKDIFCFAIWFVILILSVLRRWLLRFYEKKERGK